MTFYIEIQLRCLLIFWQSLYVNIHHPYCSRSLEAVIFWENAVFSEDKASFYLLGTQLQCRNVLLKELFLDVKCISSAVLLVLV